MSWVGLGWVGGPSAAPPFPNMQCHPIGVVPEKKEPGKFRTILHLSYPPGDSVNDFIPKDEYSLHYITVDKAISAMTTLANRIVVFKYCEFPRLS